MENIREFKINNSVLTKQNEYSVKYRAKVVSKKRVKSNIERYNLIKISLIAGLLIFSILFYIFSSVDNKELVNYSSRNLIAKNNIFDLELEVNSLNDTVSLFNSKNRIEKIAMSRLDMIYPKVDNISEIKNVNNSKVLKIADLSIDKENNKSNSKSIISALTNIFR